MTPLDIMLAHAAKAEANKPRPVEIYKQPCPHCPSMKGTDPEVEDMMTWPRDAQVDTVFPCAWRKEKMCKGYCDKLGVTEADLRAVPSNSEDKP